MNSPKNGSTDTTRNSPSKNNNSVNNPNVNLAVSVIALLANIAAFAYIMYRAKKLKVNPYMNEVFAGTKDYDKAMARRATPAELAES